MIRVGDEYPLEQPNRKQSIEVRNVGVILRARKGDKGHLADSNSPNPDLLSRQRCKCPLRSIRSASPQRHAMEEPQRHVVSRVV